MAKCAERGTTLLFVSHDTSLGGLFDRVVSLDELQHISAEAA
jgi:ABC-type lipoprotein export system ATPase subunit